MSQSIQVHSRAIYQQICDFTKNEYKSVIKSLQNISDWLSFGLGKEHALKEYVDFTEVSKSLKCIKAATCFNSIFKHTHSFLNDVQTENARRATVSFSKMGTDICGIAKWGESINAVTHINAKAFGYGKNFFQLYIAANGLHDAFNEKKEHSAHAILAETERVREIHWKWIQSAYAEGASHTFTIIVNGMHLIPLFIGISFDPVILTIFATAILVAKAASFFLKETAKRLERRL